MNDRDLKEMVVKIGDIHSKVGIIEEKCTNMEEHLQTQNSRLDKHADRLRNAELKQEGFSASQKYILLMVGGVGGLAGSILTIAIKIAIDFATNGGMAI